jgi:hypothetical protein
MPSRTSAARDHTHGATRPSIHAYRPRAAEHTVLHRIVRAHLATFLQAAESAGGVPTFVEREFRQFLGCGVWARGFARFRCDACHAERLVPFSCKARAVCPSCGGRRMAERAANLVDHVLPAVPMRQWVLSLPFRLRYLLAWNHELCREVLAVYARARRAGIRDAETGAVTAIQRFGSGLNLNIHYHTLALDGVFARDGDDWRFVPNRRRRRARSRGSSRRSRAGSSASSRAAASRSARRTRTRAIPSPRTRPPSPRSAPRRSPGAASSARAAGARVARIGNDPDAYTPKPETPWHARHAAFDLHAGRTVRADDRAGLERLAHYLLRPPLAQERIELLADGRVGVTLAHPWADGTRALVFTPVEFLEKLAVLIPKPRVNLLVYHGVLAARARHRAVALRAIPSPASAAAPASNAVAPASPPAAIVAPGLPHVSASPKPDSSGAADTA